MSPLDDDDQSQNLASHQSVENEENIELVQLLSVIRNEQPPPGSSIIAQVPEQEVVKLKQEVAKPKSTKRKAIVKSRKLFDSSTTSASKKVPLGTLGNKFNCALCERTFPQAYRLSR